MLNIQSLQIALKGGAAALPETAAEKLLCCLDAGEYDTAGRIASAAFDEGCADVRCIGAMLLGSFVERGPEVIPALLTMARYLLTEGWSALEPKSRQPAITDGALTQLFRSLKNLIEFHESARDRVWAEWGTRIDERMRPDCAQAVAQFNAAVSRLGENSRTVVALAALQAKIDSAFELAGPRAPSPLDQLERDLAPDVEHTNPPEPIGASAPSAQDSPAACDAGSRRSLLPDCVEVSSELARFMDQLRAFALLVERGDLTRAAIVAYEVRKTIESFDPVQFFPSLFASHFRILGSKIEEIAALWEQAGTPQWHVLSQHCRADLWGFVGK